MTTHTFTAANGRKYLVRLVKHGDRYGRTGCLQHDSAKPMLEFQSIHSDVWGKHF